MAPDIKNFVDSLFNFIFVFEVLMLSVQTHSNYYFYFEYASRMLYAHSKFSGATQRESYRLTQGEANLIG